MRLLHTFLISMLAFSSIAQEREGTREREVNQEGLNQRTILDDTTKIIYGMKTTSFISKENFLLSDTLFLILDSTLNDICLLYTSPSPRDATLSRMPSSA